VEPGCTVLQAVVTRSQASRRSRILLRCLGEGREEAAPALHSVPYDRWPAGDRYPTVVAWAEYDTGGHFAEVAEPSAGLHPARLPATGVRTKGDDVTGTRSRGDVRWVRDRGVVLLHDDLASDLEH